MTLAQALGSVAHQSRSNANPGDQWLAIAANNQRLAARDAAQILALELAREADAPAEIPALLRKQH
jgi:hypothetical protein